MIQHKISRRLELKINIHDFSSTRDKLLLLEKRMEKPNSKIKISWFNYAKLLTSLNSGEFVSPFKLKLKKALEKTIVLSAASEREIWIALLTMRMARKMFRKRKRLYFYIFFLLLRFSVWITISKAQVLNGISERDPSSEFAWRMFLLCKVKCKVRWWYAASHGSEEDIVQIFKLTASIKIF